MFQKICKLERTHADKPMMVFFIKLLLEIRFASLLSPILKLIYRFMASASFDFRLAGFYFYLYKMFYACRGKDEYHKTL